jgi:3-oxoadipate enol-lactonase
LLLFDTLVHGASSIPSGPSTAADLGADVLGLMDALEIEEASFCGLSMGGVIGQWLGLDAPHRLRQLVLANTAAKIGAEDTWNTRIATVLRDGMAPIVPVTLERWFTAGFRVEAPEIVEATGAILRATAPEGYTSCCAAVRDGDFREDVAQIGVPTLVISGKDDPVTPPKDGQFLANRIPRAKYVELSAAHLSNIEAATQFNAALLNFLTA